MIFIIATVKQVSFGWGFYAHKHINKHAVYSLPESTLLVFFKAHSEFLTANAVKPDQRRYIIKEEACRHYIDLDVYKKDTSVKVLPKYFSQAEKMFAADSLERHGILPWHIFKTYNMLVKAMKDKDADKTLRIASDLGHYIGDAHVPLHTTHNYDGQLTNQKGIHGLWETRVPELQTSSYDMLVGKANYIEDIQALAWKIVYNSNAAVDSVLLFESTLSKQTPDDKKYAFEERNGLTVRAFSATFSDKYAEMLNGQVERQMRKAIKTEADVWYTAWIDAGQPDLTTFEKPSLEDTQEQNQIQIKNDRFLESRNCDHHNHSTHGYLTEK